MVKKQKTKTNKQTKKSNGNSKLLIYPFLNICTLLYMKYIAKNDLTYCTGNYTQYLVITDKGKEAEKDYVLYLVAQLCLTLCNPMDCGPPGFSVHGVFQARILEWVSVSYSRASSQLRDYYIPV